jgi:hypothetical protein
MPEGQPAVSRREALRILALIGVSGAAAQELLARSPDVTPEILRAASALLDRGLEPEVIEIVAPALRRNLMQYRMLRDLEIDDLVEPAPVFLAGWK